MFRMIKNSVAIILAQVGMLTMEMVDTLIVGAYDSVELAGVAAGNGIFLPLTITATGFILGMETFVSRHHGSNNPLLRDRFFLPGIVLGLGLAGIGMIITYIAILVYPHLGIDTPIIQTTIPYLQAVVWSFPPLITFHVIQKYWYARGLTAPITILIILANILNYFLDLYLITEQYHGWQLGSRGAGLATVAARIFMVVGILILTISHFNKEKPLLLQPVSAFLKNFRALLVVGIPAGTQVLLEVGAFAICALIMASHGVVSVSAHHIMFTITCFTFMFPLGQSSSTAVIVGHYLGQKQFHNAARSGWISIFAAAAMMAIFATLFLSFPERLFRFFTSDPAIMAMGMGALPLAAAFQIFDGIQIVATGALRGLGNTKIPLLANLVSHYLVGLPVGIFFTFYLNKGLFGVWLGLCLGLMTSSVINSWFWHKLSRKML